MSEQTTSGAVELARRDALAAKYYPDQWARIANKPGASKARQKLRKAAEDDQKLEALSASGARCANCRAFDTTPIFGLDMKAHCERQSDFHGYVEAKPDQICVHWHPTSGASA